jgi:hypothetical protein
MRRNALIAAILLLATAGCAGQAFVRPQPDSLILGKTTETDVRQRFGDPYREGAMNKNGEPITRLSYAHAAGAASLVGGVTPARGQGFYFWNAVLVGHDFASSFDEDKTDFDAGKVPQIKKGETTEAEVLAVLGKPQGAYAYPLIKDRGERAIVYLYSQTKGSAFNLKFYNQLLVVTVDANALVKDVEFTSSGQR